MTWPPDDPTARSAHHMESRTCADCDADVEVEIAVDGAVEAWVCPDCGADHWDEHLTEPDPDDYNDLMADLAHDD